MYSQTFFNLLLLCLTSVVICEDLNSDVCDAFDENNCQSNSKTLTDSKHKYTAGSSLFSHMYIFKLYFVNKHFNYVCFYFLLDYRPEKWKHILDIIYKANSTFEECSETCACYKKYVKKMILILH